MPLRYLTTAQVREVLNISRPMVRRLINEGELRAIKGPARTSPLKIEEASVEEYIERHRVPVKADA